MESATTDITNELKSLICASKNLYICNYSHIIDIKPGEYMLSDHLTLEDTLPAIDIGNTKMDRGMIRIEDKPLLDFVESYFNDLFEREIDVSELLRNLFRLEMTWYTGRAYFSDTILTCILFHRDPSVVSASTGNRLAALALEATMAAASLVSYLIASSPVIREEDFHANLYGMNWWSCTYAGSHFPRFNPNGNGGEGNKILTQGEVRLELLLDQLALVCRQNPTSADRFYFARLYHWIKFLNEFIKATSISPDYASIYTLITELQSVLGDLEDDAIISTADSNIFPELANLFGFGCVRPVKPILSLNFAIKTWNRSLKDDLEGFICGLLITRPRYCDLLRKLGERSRDPLKPPMLPVVRAILYASTVQNRFETFYQYEPREKFIISSLPATVSLTKLIDLPLLMQDFVQVYCCNVARQRRFLSDLINFWDEKILKNSELKQLAGHRSICWFNHFRDILALDLVILFGYLKLLNSAEELQAAHLIHLIFEKFKSEGKPVPIVSNDSNFTEIQFTDEIRWKHRWSLVSQSVIGMKIEMKVPDSILNWYKTMVKMGLTAFSLSQPDWLDDHFSTPPVKNSVGTVFTMYTTEISEISEISESE